METTLNNQSLAGDFIPLTWKEWHALLRGIGEGWIAPGKDSEANLLDVITNIEAGAERSFKGFPLDILKQENPSLVMNEIGEAAGKVAEAYSRAKPALESFHDTIAERLSSIAKDCDITIRMKALFDSAKDNFSIDEAVALHTLASGHSFKELALDVFVDMIRINSSVGSKSFRLIPLPGGEMSFYTLLVILMLKSHELSGMASPIDPAIWSELYSPKIEWTAPVDGNAWINNYIYSEPFASEEDSPSTEAATGFLPSESDKAFLEEFLGRRTFERSRDKEELINRDFEPFKPDKIWILSKIAQIVEDRPNTLRRLFKLLYEETNYLLRTRETGSGKYLSVEDAHQVLMDDRFLQDELKGLESRLDGIFRGEYPQDKDVLSLLDQLDDFRFYTSISDKPVVSSAMVKEIIDSLILANESIMSALREAILGEQILEKETNVSPAGKSADSPAGSEPLYQSGTDAVLNELRSGGYIDNDGRVTLSGAKFARHLVKSGYVKPGKSWKPWFRNPEWIIFSEDGIISNNEIQELTKELNWKPYDGMFKDKDGKPLSSSNLSKFFSDGDSSYSKRNTLFLQIYRRLQSKINS